MDYLRSFKNKIDLSSITTSLKTSKIPDIKEGIYKNLYLSKMAKFTLACYVFYDLSTTFYANYKCKLEFVCGNKKYRKGVIENVENFKLEYFYPSLFLPLAIMQGVYGSYLKKKANAIYDLEKVKSKTG